jgi:hypothetical protein
MFRSVLVLVLAVACAAAPPTALPEPPAGESAITRVLDEFHAAAARADEKAYFDLLAEDSVFLGTDATERWDKSTFRAYAHPHFQQGKAWSFHAVRRKVTLDQSAKLAWFDEELATERLGPARGSGVLALRAGSWKIVQYNLALTIPNERFSMVREAAGAAEVRSIPKRGPLAELGWLSGSWIAKRPNGELTEEHWTSVDGGTLIGSGRSVKGGKTEFFEHLRIEDRDGVVVYSAQPLGRPPTEFRRTGIGTGGAVFENEKHDWPKRISYERTADGLAVRVSGDPDQRVEEWKLVPAIVERVRRD